MTHTHGFQHDFPQLITRRRALGLGAAGALMAHPAAACVVDATETAGPFPADGTGRLLQRKPNVLTESGVIRPDFRTSFGALSGEAAGTALDVQVQLVNAGAQCAPLEGYAVYFWHCDATGLYTLYDLEDQNYLRGVAVTDADGMMQFTTLFPGCYPSRWPHIHFEVFRSTDEMQTGRDSLLTGQVLLTEADCAAVYEADPAYSNGVANLARNSLDGDMIFRDDSAAQTEQRTIVVSKDDAGGLSGTVTIGIEA